MPFSHSPAPRSRPSGSGPRHAGVSPEPAVDLLSVAALLERRLDYIRARPGPRAPDIGPALLHRGESEPGAVDGLAPRWCLRAIEMSPVPAGSSATALTPLAGNAPAAWDRSPSGPFPAPERPCPPIRAPRPRTGHDPENGES